ncbi:MAG TPA: hypothetical protein PK280_06725 [Planctomycetota bacterium]|nr:hypothetical protein [Planctomycetota bacterium]
MIQLEHQFVTDFHRALATPIWVASCTDFVSSRISSCPLYWSGDGVGIVLADYNEERHTGPLSTCKYSFSVKVAVGRPAPSELPSRELERANKISFLQGRPRMAGGLLGKNWFPEPLRSPSDCYAANLVYEPRNGTFVAKHEVIETEETVEHNNIKLAELQSMAKQITNALTAEQFAALQCPWCGSAVDANFHSSGRFFGLSCTNKACSACSICHESVDPPSWWRTKIGGWLDG